jgi:anaphase-promoting complex subunit 5
MEAIWSAEFRGMYSYYRIAVVLLADVGLELGLAHSGRALIEEVLPQVQ